MLRLQLILISEQRRNYLFIAVRMRVTDILPSAFIKRVSDPFDFIFPLTGNQDCIEAVGEVTFTSRQIMTGGAYQSGLLGSGDAGGCATKPVTGAHPDFNEHYCIVLPHDQVDFTEAAAVIFFQQRQFLLLEKGSGALLGITAFVSCG